MAIFVLIPGIPGDATEIRHQDWIDATYYSEGISNQAAAPPVVSRPVFSNFTIRKYLDSASPGIMQAVSDGRRFNQITIEVTAFRGGREEVLMRYVLFDAAIILYLVEDEINNALPSEEVAFAFNRITWTYFPVSPTGMPEPPISGGWDIPNNRPL